MTCTSALTWAGGHCYPTCTLEERPAWGVKNLGTSDCSTRMQKYNKPLKLKLRVPIPRLGFGDSPVPRDVLQGGYNGFRQLTDETKLTRLSQGRV